MAPLSFLFVALALASMHGALGAPSDGSPPAIQPMPTSTPSVAPSASLPRDGWTTVPIGPQSQVDIDAYLDAHNDMRCQHGAEPLKWSNELSAAAQARADQCILDNPTGQYYGGTYLSFGGSFPPKARV